MTPSEVKYIVVHCSASPPKAKVDRTTIYRLHRLRGFLDIGYHWVICRDGKVQDGRPNLKNGEYAIGAHEPRVNNKSLAICLVGGVSDKDIKIAEDNFTLDQYHALALLLIDLKRKMPHAEVLGHRDIPGVAKDCPSFDVRSWYAEAVEPHVNNG